MKAFPNTEQPGWRWARRNGRWESCYITPNQTRVFMRPAKEPEPQLEPETPAERTEYFAW